ncbi:MAG TPA: hypothetical protein VGQ46_16625 [Thermoanaerobaculia bacterium]|nr:hypothetical protein [Thermoanaerobaculia bacterium]
MIAVPEKRILVADRDDIVLVLTRHVLIREGYAVDIASDTAMLDDLLRLNYYGSILVGVDLVGTDWLRALPPRMASRVIAIVSNGDGPLPVKTTIRKPLELDALAAVVAKSIEDRQLE